MSESKNLDAFAVPKKYPNIAKIFTKEWFESEFRKKKEDMHLLARDLLLIDYEEYKSSHLHIERLEEYLATMQDEIKRNRKHFSDGLRNKYASTLAEIEIASLFKNMGFCQVELEPPIPDSGKKGDIKIRDDGTEIFIEVSTKEGPETNYTFNSGLGIKGGPFKFQSPKIWQCPN